MYCKLNVLLLITRDQAARLTFVRRQKALSRAQHFGSHPALASQAGLFAQPITRDSKNAESQKKEKQKNSEVPSG